MIKTKTQRGKEDETRESWEEMNIGRNNIAICFLLSLIK